MHRPSISQIITINRCYYDMPQTELGDSFRYTLWFVVIQGMRQASGDIAE
ncbi:hypothetical protein AA0313_2207 [Acetobacter indonesiensis NRIC 0313]|nr:hypothetical protein AA0313_2207 [Acetobacter indonesiensis NRIC 0313]